MHVQHCQVVPGISNPSIHTYTDATFKRKVKEDKEERRLLRADMGEMKDEVSASVEQMHVHACAYAQPHSYTCICIQVGVIKASVEKMHVHAYAYR